MPTAPACAHHPPLCPSRRLSASWLYRGLRWVSEGRGAGRGLGVQAPLVPRRCPSPQVPARPLQRQAPLVASQSPRWWLLPGNGLVLPAPSQAGLLGSGCGGPAGAPLSSQRERLPAFSSASLAGTCKGVCGLQPTSPRLWAQRVHGGLPVAAGWPGAGPPQTRRFGRSHQGGARCGGTATHTSRWEVGGGV